MAIRIFICICLAYDVKDVNEKKMSSKDVMYTTCMFSLMRLMVHGFLNADVRAPVVEKMASGGSTTS